MKDQSTSPKKLKMVVIGLGSNFILRPRAGECPGKAVIWGKSMEQMLRTSRFEPEAETRRVDPSVDRRGQANATFVVGASGSQPRVGWLLTEPTSLIDICRPRVFAPFTSTSAGLQVCWWIF